MKSGAVVCLNMNSRLINSINENTSPIQSWDKVDPNLSQDDIVATKYSLVFGLNRAVNSKRLEPTVLNYATEAVLRDKSSGISEKLDMPFMFKRALGSQKFHPVIGLQVPVLDIGIYGFFGVYLVESMFDDASRVLKTLKNHLFQPNNQNDSIRQYFVDAEFRRVGRDELMLKNGRSYIISGLFREDLFIN